MVITVLEAFQYGDFFPDPYIAVNSFLVRLVTEYVPILKWVPVLIWWSPYRNMLLPFLSQFPYGNFCFEIVITVSIWLSPFRNVQLPCLSLFPYGNFCSDMVVTVSIWWSPYRNVLYHVYPCFYTVISVSIWSLLFWYGDHHIKMRCYHVYPCFYMVR